MSTSSIDDLERLRAESAGPRTTPDNANTWPDPLPLDDTAVVPFPVDAFPRILSDFVADVARVRQVPPDLPALLALSVISASVARRAVVRIAESHTEPLNLYVAVVAASGERKTPPFRDCLDPVYRAQRELQRAAEPIHRAAVERRAAQMKRLEHLRTQAARENDPSVREQTIAEAEQLACDLTPEPVLPRLLVDDRTPERLEVDLAEQGGALLLASEEAGTLFAVAAGRYARDGGDQAETLLKAYDGGRIDTHRITRAAVACDAPALSICVTPQPIILEQLREHPALHHRGLLPRFLWAIPATLAGGRLYDVTSKPDPTVHRGYADLVTRLLELYRPSDPEALPALALRDDALAAWVAYADRVERDLGDGGRLAPIREWASKQAGRVARIAGGLHLVETVGAGRGWVAAIPRTVVESATAIGAYLEAHALKAYDVMWTDPRIRTARAVLRWLERTTPREITVRSTHAALSRAVAPDREAVVGGLNVLVEHGYLRPLPSTPTGRPGRPASAGYAVHPAPCLRAPTAPRNPQNPQSPDDPGHCVDIVAPHGASGRRAVGPNLVSAAVLDGASTTDREVTEL
jgi:hypothetical protein